MEELFEGLYESLLEIIVGIDFCSSISSICSRYVSRFLVGCCKCVMLFLWYNIKY